ncbi:MAG: hypothetical protein IKQ09_02845 [Bacteroidales bacterium]|nr:hypothetical protein [Bacteroidales bacterium]
MTKKVKKPISRPKRKGGSKSKKSNNFITRLIVIIFVLILAFFLIFSVFRPSPKAQGPEVQTTQIVEEQQNDKVKPVETPKPKEEVKVDEKTTPKEEKKAAETKVVAQSIKGTWQSTTGGAFLTMDGKGYRLDFMGVDSDQPIIGTYSVDGDLITFVNKKDPCKDVKGLYEVKFNKNEIGFKCKSDDCTKRRATLPTEWEWLDVED